MASVRVFWSGPGSVTVNITTAGSASTNFSIGGTPVTFPYTISTTTKFDTSTLRTYSVSVQYQGTEVATSQGVPLVFECQGEPGASISFAPSAGAVGAPTGAEPVTGLDADVAAKVTSGTATPAALSSAYAAIPNLNGTLPIYAYGNSYSVLNNGTCSAGKHYLQQSQARLRAASTITSYGAAGTRIVDVLSGLINGSAIGGCNAPVTGAMWPGTIGQRQGLIVLESLYNDIGHYPNSQVATSVPTALNANGNYRAGYRNMLRAALAIMSSDSRVEDSAATYTGTWTTQSLAYTSGGTVHYATAPGAKASFTVTPPQTGPLAGKVHLVLWKWDTAAGITSAAVTIDVDGASSTTYTPNSWEQYTGQPGTNVPFVPDCQTVTVPVDGNSHTINVTHAGSSGQYAYVDFVSIPSVTPNPIAVMGNETGPVAGTYWTAPQAAVWLQNQAVMLGDAKSVTAEFPNAFYVPSTITSNGIYSGDGIHPNDRGHAQRSADLVDAAFTNIKARMESYVLQQAANSAFAVL